MQKALRLFYVRLYGFDDLFGNDEWSDKNPDKCRQKEFDGKIKNPTGNWHEQEHIRRDTTEGFPTKISKYCHENKRNIFRILKNVCAE